MLQKIKHIIPHNFFLRICYHKITAWLAALYFGFPGRQMTVIAITGTDGKTTTSSLIYSILKGAHLKVGLASSIRLSDGNKEWINETHKTTMGRFDLQRLLKRMLQNKCSYVVLEVSSHAIVQGRIIGIPIDIAIMTNMSHEHLDYHKTFENYRRVKLKLFQKLKTSRKLKNQKKIAVSNIDDNTSDYILKIHNVEHIGYSIQKTYHKKTYHHTLSAQNIQSTAKGISFDVSSENDNLHIELPLKGEYNAYNSLAAIAVAKALNIDSETIQSSLHTVQTIPGRFEIVSPPKTPFLAAIDYAVTENAFIKLFTTARNIVGEDKKVIVVFGACGDRDKEKRPRLGKVASQLCDICVITDEEPYFENPQEIRKMILAGIDRNHSQCIEIPDRKKAIEKAISLAKPGDIVIVTGMGDQTSMVVGDTIVPWSDRGVIQSIIKHM